MLDSVAIPAGLSNALAYYPRYVVHAERRRAASKTIAPILTREQYERAVLTFEQERMFARRPR